MMTYTYTTNVQHWTAYVIAAQQNMRRVAKRSGRGTMLAWFALVAVFIVAGPWLANLGFGAQHALSFSVGTLGAWLLLTLYMWRWQMHSVRIGPRPDGYVLGARTLVFDEDGFIVRGPLQEDTLSWRLVQGVEVADDIVVIWLEPVVGIFVPKSAFGDDAGLAQALEFIERHIEQS